MFKIWNHSLRECVIETKDVVVGLSIFLKSFLHVKKKNIKKMWYTYTMEYCSAIKRNETGPFVETWMNLETVIQSEVRQKEKNEYHILTHIRGT